MKIRKRGRSASYPGQEEDMDKSKLLEQIQLFVLDMDGTFYLGDRILDGALEFVNRVEAVGKQFLFFTNNSSKSPDLYIEKLGKMGCRIERSQIITSGDVTIGYLKRHYKDRLVYLVGTPVLEQDFRQAGIRLAGAEESQKADVVVVGFDTTLTYEKLSLACSAIRNGAVFLATHLDINCPTEDGFIPDCGAICEAISLSTGKKPKYLGKPFSETLDMVLGATGQKAERTAFVGDRLYTDVACGVNNGAVGILVLTGEAGLSDVEVSDVKPDGIFASLGEMTQYL